MVAPPKKDLDYDTRQDADIETLRDALDQVQTRLDALATRLGQLSAGQEALELQTALLAGDAEEGFAGAAAPPSMVEDAAASVRLLEQLQAQLNELNASLETAAAQTDRRVEALEGQLRELQQQVLDREFATPETPGIADAPSPATPDAEGGPDTAPDAPLEGRLRTIVDDVQALQSTGQGLGSQVAKLQAQQDELQDSLKALSLQQVRTDHDVRQLEQRSRRAALAATAAALLSAAIVAWFILGA